MIRENSSDPPSSTGSTTKREGLIKKLRRVFKHDKKVKKLLIDDSHPATSGRINICTLGVILGQIDEEHCASGPETIDQKESGFQVDEESLKSENKKTEENLKRDTSMEESKEEELLGMYKEMHQIRKEMILKEKKFQEQKLEFYKFQLEAHELFGPKIFTD